MLLHLLEKINTKRIILASASPRRSSALRLKIEIVPSVFKEDLEKKTFTSPVDYVAATARAKSEEVFSRPGVTADLVISADTIVVLDEKILEKPTTPGEAKAMLKSLSGRSHIVYTAVSLTLRDDSNKVHTSSFVEGTSVVFAELTDQCIEAYVKTGTPMDKAGGYGIQEEIGSSFVKKIDGCFWNVTGFPLHSFCSKLLDLMDGKWNFSQ